jgi:hypothetical protein
MIVTSHPGIGLVNAHESLVVVTTLTIPVLGKSVPVVSLVASVIGRFTAFDPTSVSFTSNPSRLPCRLVIIPFRIVAKVKAMVSLLYVCVMSRDSSGGRTRLKLSIMRHREFLYIPVILGTFDRKSLILAR